MPAHRYGAKRSSTRAERTIDEGFQRSRLEPWIRRAPFGREGFEFCERIVKIQPLGDARGQLPFAAQLLIDQEILLAERNIAADFKVSTILQ